MSEDLESIDDEEEEKVATYSTSEEDENNSTDGDTNGLSQEQPADVSLNQKEIELMTWYFHDVKACTLIKAVCKQVIQMCDVVSAKCNHVLNICDWLFWMNQAYIDQEKIKSKKMMQLQVQLKQERAGYLV